MRKVKVLQPYAVIAFREGKCLGQWGFAEEKSAQHFVLSLQDDVSFGFGGFTVSVLRRIEMWKSGK